VGCIDWRARHRLATLRAIVGQSGKAGRIASRLNLVCAPPQFGKLYRSLPSVSVAANLADAEERKRGGRASRLPFHFLWQARRLPHGPMATVFDAQFAPSAVVTGFQGQPHRRPFAQASDAGRRAGRPACGRDESTRSMLSCRRSTKLCRSRTSRPRNFTAAFSVASWSAMAAGGRGPFGPCGEQRPASSCNIK